jgi:hypothetical protein
MDAHPRCGVAAPRLMREDSSLASAGFEFRADGEGRWDARAMLRGFPCDFADAVAAAPVAALGHGCLVVRRSLFELAGGFAEDYFEAQRQAVDFSARVKSHGLEVWRTATQPLFDLSVSLAATPVAQALDRRTLEQRWRTAGAAAETQAETSPAPDAANTKTRQRSRRRRRAA